jgi:drug/metabolite transporter (DMT)-like permease
MSELIAIVGLVCTVITTMVGVLTYWRPRRAEGVQPSRRSDLRPSAAALGLGLACVFVSVVTEKQVEDGITGLVFIFGGLTAVLAVIALIRAVRQHKATQVDASWQALIAAAAALSLGVLAYLWVHAVQ